MAVEVVSKVEVPELVEKRQQQILQAAIELYGSKGYHVTTIREVAQRAKVSVGLIYQYVQDKEDVLFLAVSEVLDSYLREIPRALIGVTDPMARFRAAVRAYGHVIDKRIDATLLVYRETKSLGRQRRDVIKAKELESNTLISDTIHQCIREGLFEAVDIEMLTYMIVMFCHAWALKSWVFRGRLTIDQYIDRGLDMLLNPVITARGRRSFATLADAEVAPIGTRDKPATPAERRPAPAPGRRRA